MTKLERLRESSTRFFWPAVTVAGIIPYALAYWLVYPFWRATPKQ